MRSEVQREYGGALWAIAVEDGAVTNVTGNFCPRGAQYAKEELTAPTRMPLRK